MEPLSIQSDPLHVVVLQIAGFVGILSITRPQQLDRSGDAADNFFVGHVLERLEGIVSRLQPHHVAQLSIHRLGEFRRDFWRTVLHKLVDVDFQLLSEAVRTTCLRSPRKSYRGTSCAS